MDETVFRDYLSAAGVAQEDIETQVSFINGLESTLKQKVPSWTLADLNGGSTQELVDELIDQGENSLENLLALARYARATQQTALFTTVFCMLDGYEAMDQLYEKLESFAGEDLRDIIFEDMPLPPLGLSRREKSRYTYRLIRRMETIFEESTTREILKDSLRILPDEMYTTDRDIFDKDCHGSIDCYLEQKGQRFIQTLEEHRDRNQLFFGQVIDTEVIAFVQSNPEILQGVRQDRTILETKIPYNTKAYLAESDPDKKRYHYCHCPWARESILKRTFTVSATFCQCSAGFHKKRYEVIFDQPIRAEVLQSVLQGDQVCQFAIHLPEEIQLG